MDTGKHPPESGDRPLYRYRFGSAVFDEGRMELRVGDLAVDIEPRPLDLLSVLLRARGQLVSKDTLLDTVWQAEDVSEAVIPSAAKKLRQALTEENAAHIVTVHGKGYRFDMTRNGGVTRTPVGSLPASVFKLEAGEPAPHKDQFILDRLLDQTRGAEVWRARRSTDGELRVFKFAAENVRLTSLKREVTLSMLLHAALGERADIVTVYGWNFETPPYYMECQYGGDNLAAWAREQNHLVGLTRSQRLELFLSIAESLRAAHSVGVLHKDLKPSNILIAAAPSGWQPRLADFGSGRLLDTAHLKHYGIDPLGLTLTQGIDVDSRSGTPFYLAPELREGQAATQRSDVYALGLLLYQLLACDFGKMLGPGWERDIDDDFLRADISAATDSDPARRLASVGDLIDRVRSLDQRRQQARRHEELKLKTTLQERELERSRARRPWLAFGFASLSAALLISLWMYSAQERAHRQAELERTRAEAISTFLNDDVLGAGDPVLPGGNRNATINDALARAEHQLDSRFRTDPLTKASVELALARAYFGQTNYARAEYYQRQALNVLQSGTRTDDLTTLNAEYALARTLDMRGQYKEASALLTAADTRAGPKLRESSPLTLLALWSRGNNDLMQFRPESALAAFERADRVRAASKADDAVWLLRIHSNLAWCYVRLNRNEDAINILGGLMNDRYAAESVGALDWTKAHLQYGLALTNLGRYPQAEAAMRDTIATTGRVLGADNYLTGLAWNHLAATYQAEGRWNEAIESEHRALEIVRARLGPEGAGTLGIYGSLGALEYLAGQRDRGLADLQSVRGQLLRVLGPSAPFTQLVTFYLAAALNDTGASQEAASLVQLLNPTDLSAAEANGHWKARLAGLQGQILMRQGDRQRAVALLNGSITDLGKEHAQPWILQPLQRTLATRSLSQSATP